MEKQRGWLHKLLPSALFRRQKSPASAPQPIIVKSSAPPSSQALLDNGAVFSISEKLPEKAVYHSYPERWWLLATVILLNLANYSHWVAFPAVTKV